MTNKLTDAQIVFLHSSLQRIDRCIVLPIGNGGSPMKWAARMIGAGWLEEVTAKATAPIWRKDRATRSDFSLTLTPAAFKTIGAREKPVLKTDPIAEKPGDLEADERIATTASQCDVQEGDCVLPKFEKESKVAMAVVLLRDGSATNEQLSTVMKWLPHPMLACRTGLRAYANRSPNC